MLYLKDYLKELKELNELSDLKIDKQEYIIYPSNGCIYNTGSGGITVCFYMVQLLKNKGIRARICCEKIVENPISNDYYIKGDAYNKDTIVIYGESVEGNPLNAKYIVRWILGPYYNSTTISTWNPTDIVYFFNYDEKHKFSGKHIHVDSLYKTLTIIYMNPIFKNENKIRSINHAHLFHKTLFYHKKITHIHPEYSIEMPNMLPHNELFYFFNLCETFISYDPITFSTFIAALCGCVSVVYPIENITEKEWIEMTCLKQYSIDRKINKLNGIAYGYENIEHAKSTLHLVQEQWNDIIHYLTETSIDPFLKEMQTNKENTLNIVTNIYY